MPELKISSKQAISLLKQVGVEVAEISTEDNAEFKTDEAVKSVYTSARKILEPQIIEENKDTVLSQMAGRAAGVLQAKLARRTGIEKSELKGLDDEAMMEKALAYYESKLGKDTEGLREEMKVMAETHKNSLTKREAELLAQVEEANNKYKSHFITESLVDEIKDMTLIEGTDRIYAAKLLQRELSELGLVNYDENTKKISLRDKKNPELPLYNEAKTSELKAVDIANQVFGKLGMLQKDMRGTPPVGMNGNNGRLPNNAPVNNVPSAVGNVDLVEVAKKAGW